MVVEVLLRKVNGGGGVRDKVRGGVSGKRWRVARTAGGGGE